MRAVFLLLLFAFSCADVEPLPVEPCDAARIEGRWQAMDAPGWLMDFRAPHLRQWIDIGGTVPVEQHYLYATRRDTLWASGTGGQRMWLVCFPDDTTAHVRQWAVWKWSPVKVLRRR